MNKSKVFLIFALCLFAYQAQAQIQLNNISAGASYWHRTYEDVNEQYFLIAYEAEEGYTKGGVMPHFGAELNIIRGLALDARVAYWTADYESTGVFGDLRIVEKIEQTMIPVSAGLLYRFDDIVRDDINLFVGAGIDRFFIQNDVSRTITGGSGQSEEDSFSGNNYGVYAKGGIEYYFTNSLGLALEARYKDGYYNQSTWTSTESGQLREQVSVRGLEVGISLRYRFNTVESTPDTPETNAVD